MTPDDYASLVDDVYNALRQRKWLDSAALDLTKVYFTSGAYRNDPEYETHEEDDA
jgi:hypothetical protein